jgi:hypothetical protein
LTRISRVRRKMFSISSMFLLASLTKLKGASQFVEIE